MANHRGRHRLAPGIEGLEAKLKPEVELNSSRARKMLRAASAKAEGRSPAASALRNPDGTVLPSPPTAVRVPIFPVPRTRNSAKDMSHDHDGHHGSSPVDQKPYR